LRERRRVEVDVERVAVRRHPLRDVNADRGDLARRRREPNARQPFDSRRVHAESTQRHDQSFLEVAAVVLDVFAVPRQVQDRIADELSGPVVRRLPAAIGLHDLHVRLLGDVQLTRLGAPPERDDGRMLE
jgi:hypothetical protein